MADLKISQLPAAATLDGTELVAVVQSGTTDQTTVANVLSAGLPVSASTLSASGNTTLGDASTDTVQVNGYMGVGGAATVVDNAIHVKNTQLAGAAQTGVVSEITATSASTVAIQGFRSNVATAASAFTVADVSGFRMLNSTKGAGSTITNQHGVNIADLTSGTNNYGITSAVSSGANKWNIYASGTAANYFAGNVGIGTNTPTQARFVVSNNTASLDTAFITASINGTGRGLVISANTRTFSDDAIASFESISRLNGTTLATTVAGNVGVGGKVNPASGAATLCIFNGTAPTGSVADGIILYAEDVTSSSELKVRDEAGNVTTLSPHNFSLIPEGPSEDMAWAYYSEKDGKRINVDMLKLARMVEKLTGEKLVYED